LGEYELILQHRRFKKNGKNVTITDYWKWPKREQYQDIMAKEQGARSDRGWALGWACLTCGIVTTPDRRILLLKGARREEVAGRSREV
jgi:hypothetical protein